MKAKHKKIALLMDSWKRFFTYAWPCGILQRIHETDEDVNLYIFSSSGNWSYDEAYNEGEYNIFRLPDLEEFDGIILDLNNFSSQSAMEEVVQRAQNSEVPVISIANEFRNFYYVGIDNYRAMRNMIAHLHEKHGCRRFWFAMGIAENYENQRRDSALRDYMLERGLPFEEKDFYYGDFEYQTGVRAFETLLEAHGCLPDAIVCANDNIAVGVCEAAARRGYHPPQDFCVTGFDDFEKAAYYDPRISTVGHVRETVGYRCADVLLRLWRGETVPRYTYTDTECLFRESCGCQGEKEEGDRQHLKEEVLSGIDSCMFDEQALFFSYELMRAGTVEEMLDCIPAAMPALRCSAIYVVLDERIDFYKRQTEAYHNPGRAAEEIRFCERGYPDRMQLRFVYRNGKRMPVPEEYIRKIFPYFELDERGHDQLFVPLHFRSHAVGYFVVENAVYLMEYRHLFRVTNALNTALENLHRNEKLAYMNRALSWLYIRDSMTGIYNRRGYQELGGALMRSLHEDGKNALILFADLDGLKQINDTLGHEYGDFAITAVASVLRQYSGADGIPARTGGDEFVLIREWAPGEETAALVCRIRTDLAQYAQQIKFPAELDVSIGIRVTDPGEGKRLEDYVREADEKMYREKQSKQAARRTGGLFYECDM